LRREIVFLYLHASPIKTIIFPGKTEGRGERGKGGGIAIIVKQFIQI
jgi:hypothetical protein